MAELSLDEALDALNTARAYLSPEAAEIFIYGDNMGVDALVVSDFPRGELKGFLATVEAAAEVVTRAMGEAPDALFLTSDHRGRWVLIPNVT